EQPLATALAAVMASNRGDRAEAKMRIYRRLGQIALDEARIFLLANMVESYLPLSAEEETRMWATLRAEGVNSMATTSIPWGEPTWATRMEEQGERKALLRVLEARFGSLPAQLIERIEAADGALIEQFLDRAGTASSLRELESLVAR
ncbi:MAG TPA: hypothetical protein VNL71_11880, partial [Chloroflexota bacterium]|nr:hypothetical protein [Chloroflexota bacterium]